MQSKHFLLVCATPANHFSWSRALFSRSRATPASQFSRSCAISFWLLSGLVMVMLSFREVSVLESFASAFRSPVTGFGDRIYGAVSVIAIKVCGCVEEAEMGEGLQTMLTFGQEKVRKGLQRTKAHTSLISTLAPQKLGPGKSGGNDNAKRPMKEMPCRRLPSHSERARLRLENRRYDLRLRQQFSAWRRRCGCLRRCLTPNWCEGT
jgi:hypothetical protein